MLSWNAVLIRNEAHPQLVTNIASALSGMLRFIESASQDPFPSTAGRRSMAQSPHWASARGETPGHWSPRLLTNKTGAQGAIGRVPANRLGPSGAYQCTARTARGKVHGRASGGCCYSIPPIPPRLNQIDARGTTVRPELRASCSCHVSSCVAFSAKFIRMVKPAT